MSYLGWLFPDLPLHAVRYGFDPETPWRELADDIRDVVVPCLAHRLLPAGMAAATLDAHEQAASPPQCTG